MSAASSDHSFVNNDSLADQFSVGAHDDQLTARVERLIQTCRTLDLRRKEYQETAERLAEENTQLRRVLSHTQQQIQQLVEQIRQMEE
jgi:chromosome segregation ATPase